MSALLRPPYNLTLIKTSTRSPTSNNHWNYWESSNPSFIEKTWKIVSIRSTLFCLTATINRSLALKNSIRSTRALHQLWETYLQSLAPSLGPAISSTEYLFLWNSSRQNSPNWDNTRPQLNNSTRLAIPCSLTNTCGAPSGPSRSKRQRLVSKPRWSSVTPTTTSSTSTSTLKFLPSSVRQSVSVVLESTFPSQPKSSYCKKKSSSTTTISFSSFSESTTESWTKSDPTLSHS